MIQPTKPFYVTVYAGSLENNDPQIHPHFSRYKAYPILSIYHYGVNDTIFLVPDDRHIIRSINSHLCLFYDHDTILPKEDTNEQ